MRSRPSVFVAHHHSACDVAGEQNRQVFDRVFGRHDLTPLWIADLDFAVCPQITEALLHRLKHPVLGYSEATAGYWQSIIDWNLRRHRFGIAREELCFIPGVVKGIALAVNYFTQKGDGVVIQPRCILPSALWWRAMAAEWWRTPHLRR